MSNVQVTLKDYKDVGAMVVEDFPVLPAPELSAKDLQEGEVLIELKYMSVDPYMRGRMRNVAGYFVGPFAPGKPLDNSVVARVIASRSDAVAEGALVTGFLPWQKVQVVAADNVPNIRVIQTPKGLPESVHIGALGMVGMTAYGSLAKIAKPQPGETAFVSGAAGAVGSIVGQLLKNVYGCKVVGSAGSDEKVAWLKSLGFDAAWNYKTTSTAAALAQHCPDGVDIYFDNVGSQTLEAALNAMNNFGRIVGCGSISMYDTPESERYGVKNLFNIISKRLLFQGFIVSDLMAEYQEAFARDMPRYLQEGKVTVTEYVVEGIENAGQCFCDMMAGKNLGKAIVKV